MIRSIATAAAAILFFGFTAATAQTTGGHSLDAVSTQLRDRFVCNVTANGSALAVSSRATGRQLATVTTGEKGVIRMEALVGQSEEISGTTRRTLLSTLSFLNTSLPIGTLGFASNGGLILTHHVGTQFANVDEITRIVVRMIDQAEASRVEIIG